MALGNKIIFWISFLAVFTGCYTVSNADLDCSKVEEVESYISFYNIDSNLLKNLKLLKVCAKDTETICLIIRSTDTISNYDINEDTFFEVRRVHTDQIINLNKKCKYYLHLNNIMINLKVESFKKHYKNTMLSEDCECKLDWYSLDSISKNNGNIEVSRTDLVVLKKI